MTDILLVTGLSGAGRSQAADDLEDLGWFVVDNLPVVLYDSGFWKKLTMRKSSSSKSSILSFSSRFS